MAGIIIFQQSHNVYKDCGNDKAWWSLQGCFCTYISTSPQGRILGQAGTTIRVHDNSPNLKIL